MIFLFFFAIYFLKNYQLFKTVLSLTIAFYEKNQYNSTNHNLEYDLSWLSDLNVNNPIWIPCLALA